MIRAAIYDFDELMADSMSIHIKAWKKVFEHRNIDVNSMPQNILKSFVGMRLIDITKEIVKYFKLPDDPQELFEKREKIFIELVKEEIRPMPGLKKSLHFFKDNNIRICLASSGTREYIQTAIKKLEISTFLEFLITGEDVTKGKPDPEPYLLAVKKLNFPANECVVLEDAGAGVTSAKSAGCKCIAVDNKQSIPQDLSKADIVLDSLEEINSAILNKIE